jgi:mono/diheme cytochrome c family protein
MSGPPMSPRSRARLWLIPLAVFVLAADAAAVSAQAGATSATASALTLETGKQIYEAGCVSCHGRDGKGQPQTLAGFEPPDTFPDFSDCPTSTPESNVQWRAVISNGGPARAFSPIMPSFKDLLTAEQIDKVIEYVRGMCKEAAWPRGDLNLPRPLLTEKAFPENETVIAASINAHGSPGVSSQVIYEHRIGATAMMEAIVPYAFTHESGNWDAAFGDLGLGYKQKLFHSLATGSIVSAGGELTAPTGDRNRGTGGESTVFELFGAYGQLLPGSGFLQVHTGFELPAHPRETPRAYFLRTAIGKTFATDGGLGRRWSPMVELAADRDLVTGGAANWDVVPQIQIPMSKRLHVLGNLGFRLPANNTADRPRQVLFYVLWDWFDGGLLQGW